MNRFFRLVIVPLLIILVALFLGKMLIASKQEPAKKSTQTTLPMVEVVTAQAQPYQFTVKSQANVQSAQSLLISSDIAAKVIWVSSNYKLGQQVTAGELLMKLDDANYRLKVAQAKAALADSAIRLRNEEAEMRRAKKLSKTAAAARKAKLDQVKSSHEVAQLTLENAEKDLAKTKITAPINGVIDQLHIDLGQYVGAGSAMFKLLLTDKAEVRLPITAEQMNYLQLPTETSPINVLLTANYGENQYQWPAKIQRIEQRVDEASKVFYWIAQVEQPYNTERHGQSLWFGTYVNATVMGKQLGDVFVLPVSAIFNKQYIYRVVDGQLKKQFVNVLRRVNNYVVIKQGINTGDQIVLSRLDLMVDGMLVETRQKEMINEVNINHLPAKAAN